MPPVEAARPYRGQQRRALCDRFGSPSHSNTEKYVVRTFRLRAKRFGETRRSLGGGGQVRRETTCPLNTSIVCLSTAPESISPASIPRSFVSRWPHCRRTSCGGGRTRT